MLRPAAAIVSMTLIAWSPASILRAEVETSTPAAATTEETPQSADSSPQPTETDSRPSESTAATETTAKPEEQAPPEDRSGGLFGQFLGTIDNFYTDEPRPGAHDPQIGIAESTSARRSQPASTTSPETKANREGNANIGGSNAPPARAESGQQPTVAQQAPAAEPSNAPRWARGGLLGSFFDKDKAPQATDERMVQLPTSQAPPVAKTRQKPTRSTVPDDRPQDSQAAAPPSAGKPSWMSRLMSPLMGKDEPAEQQANNRPVQRSANSQVAQQQRPNSQSTQRMANSQPMQRQANSQPTQRMASNQPAGRPAPSAQAARPVGRSPVTRVARPEPEPQVRHWPSMEPTVAIQFGHGRPDPTQPQMQLAEGQQPASRSVAQATPRAATSGAADITPIANDRVAANTPRSATAEQGWASHTIDLADMLPTAPRAAGQVTIGTSAVRTPTMADDHAKSEIKVADKPLDRSGVVSSTASNAPLPSLDLAVKFDSSAGKLGLAELASQGRPQDAKQPASDRNLSGKSTIEVARQPRTVR